MFKVTTHTLFNLKKKMYEQFKIYDDFDVFSDDNNLLSRHYIEQQQDDDVDTDSEILYSAIRTCHRDFDKALAMTKKPEKTEIDAHLLHNFRIKDRTKHPQMYDRQGVLKREYRNEYVKSDSLVTFKKIHKPSASVPTKGKRF